MGRTLKTDPPASILDGGNFRQNFVKVETDKGSLRLRFSHGGKRYAMAVGLPDSKINRVVAQQKATQLELDIASGNFDATLKKYKPPQVPAKKSAVATAIGLFNKFTTVQAREKG